MIRQIERHREFSQLNLTRAGIQSVWLCLKEAITLRHANKIASLSGFELVAYRIQVSNMAVTAFCLLLSSNL